MSNEGDDADRMASVHGVSRRRLLGFVLAAPTLAVAARLGLPPVRLAEAAAAVPSPPGLADLYDLSDLGTDAARLTAGLISISVGRDGIAAFALPRAEVGQGITTACAMVIADEMDLPLSKVRVTLADARPELMWNQITGGSNSMHALYEPLRTAAALARQRLTSAAAALWGVPVASVTTREGVVHAPDGRSTTYGSLAEAAASTTVRAELVTLKAPASQTLVGRPHRRIDGLAAVTGTKTFAMDVQVPGALPTMVCRAPTLRGTVVSVANMPAVKRMPGITDVGVISTGVAVRGSTFGQCIDAIRALRVTWGPGTVDRESNATVLEKLKAAEIPMVPAGVPAAAETIDHTFTFHFRSGSALETNCAVADVRPDSAEVWSSLKCPIVFQQDAARLLGLDVEAVVVHVTEGGGSFGRHVFADAALEAVAASKLFGMPVRLMWHRTDDFRHGRMHPMSTSRVRATIRGGEVVAYDQHLTSVATDFTNGLGEMWSAFATRTPYGSLTVAQGAFTLSAKVPYNYGHTTQMLTEIFDAADFPTGTVRNVYSPAVRTAQELITDQIAKHMRVDAVQFRREHVKDPRLQAVLDKAASVGRWGRHMAKGTAQGIAVHSEYKSHVACLVEIDCRSTTTNRKIENAYTGPRVTKVVIAVDVGLPLNPKGLEAQMTGGAMDGIAQALTCSLHLRDGLPLESSWDNYWYTRQWNIPPVLHVVVMPSTSASPGGAGELSCGVAQAAVACAYARATGRLPTEFPINHRQPLGFVPLPTEPPVPQSPVDGLRHVR